MFFYLKNTVNGRNQKLCKGMSGLNIITLKEYLLDHNFLLGQEIQNPKTTRS